MTTLTEYKKAIVVDFRKTDNNGNKLLNEVRDWWGEKKHKGPKMKVKHIVRRWR